MLKCSKPQNTLFYIPNHPFRATKLFTPSVKTPFFAENPALPNSRMNKILIVYICLLNCFVSVKGQTHDNHLFTRQDGFPFVEMQSVVRDAFGRMWFSANTGGVAFYDGKKFSTLSDTSAHSMLNSLVILKTVENDSTIVLYAPQQSFSLVRDGKIKNYRSEEYPILKGVKLPFSYSKEERIFGINSSGIVFQFDRKTDNFLDIGHVPIGNYSLSEFDYNSDTKTFYLLLSSGFTLKIIKGQLGGQWTKIREWDIRVTPILGLYCTHSSGELIDWNNNKITCYDGQKWQEVHLPLNTKNITNPIVYLQHQTDRFFLVLKKDENRRQIFELTEDFKVLSSVIISSRSNFTGIEKDLAGNFWVATRDGQFKVTPTFFNLFSRETDGMIADLHSIAEERNGNVWFGSYSEGLSKFDGDQLTKHPKGTNPVWKFLPGSILHNGQILMNLENQGLRLVSFDGKTWAQYLKDINLFYITKLSNGRLALGGGGGLGLALQKEVGNRYHDTTDFYWVNASKGMKLFNVIGIAEDRLGRIWMGRPSQGIAVYDPHLDTAFTWLIQNATTDFGAMALTSDYKGNIWFGTTKGVFFYQTPAKNSTINDWTQFNPFRDLQAVAKDFLDNTGKVSSLKIWKNKYLIVGKANGFSLIDIEQFYASDGKRFPIFNYNEKNGFSGGKTEQNALWIDRNEKIWIGHDKGATLFDIKNYPFDTIMPPLSIDSLIGGKTLFYPKLGENNLCRR
jgi:hypothetical protein